MVDLKLKSSIILPAITAWGAFCIATLLAITLSKTLHFNKTLTIAIIITTAFGNSSFLGIPFTKAFFGDSAIAYAICMIK